MTTNAPRPQTIVRAALCLWFSVALTLLVTAAQVLGLAPLVGSTAGMTVTIGLVTAGFLALIAVSISSRRGWGRWLFAVIYVLGTLGLAMLVAMTPETFRTFPMVLQANMVVQFALQTAALVLMFSSTSRQWFRPRHAATAP